MSVNAPKPKKNYNYKKSRKIQKNLITQDNRLIYSQYNEMTTNEIKVFLWAVSKLNPTQDTHFIPCKIPISEIFGALEHKETENYTYIKKLCDNLAKRTFTDETLSIDPTTNEQVEEFATMPIFQVLKYKKKQAEITYQLNDYIKPYLLGLKKSFTQTPLDCILPMKSYYAIRIYQMLLSEIKQNKNTLKINVAYLQEILSVAKSLLVWQDFKRFVLEKAQKEINKYSDIVLVEIEPHKQGRKITDITFHFEYKSTDKRIVRDKTKQNSYINAILDAFKEFLGKTIAYEVKSNSMPISCVYEGDCEVVRFENCSDELKNALNTPEKYKNRQVAVMKLKDRESGKIYSLAVRDLNSIQKIRERQAQAESLFYQDTKKVKDSFDIQNAVKNGTLFEYMQQWKQEK
ncbi:replication initiation protein [Helicobacter cetorum]|uniref:RepB n=1 Tax=Helicobacter cetorum (strain ATCC BAA-540 / CCUG 52418 / MIT 99-5656) TaxID=1163745 RepID=I0EUU9_HELCM|nr:replication initiation protein [Helicobacter cetorum]AFI06718.1 RepB [Helicobacter cetorum MIT 99-5656]